MKLVAVLLGEGMVAVVAAASGLDGSAEKIVLYSAAGAGLLWFHFNVLRPLAKLIKRTVEAVGAFERLPGWQEETDERLAALEHEIVHVHNGNKAIIRELGIEDQVRRIDPRSYGLSHDEVARPRPVVEEP